MLHPSISDKVSLPTAIVDGGTEVVHRLLHYAALPPTGLSRPPDFELERAVSCRVDGKMAPRMMDPKY